VKRRVGIITIAILCAGLVLFGLSDTVLSIADTSVPGNEVASSGANNASATATIVITMTGAFSE